ncbi:MAG: hypothetical protein Q4F81_07625 [Eubacteriales bacterium]|nr:hypothetical protein [Eubacteriales bacterium]
MDRQISFGQYRAIDLSILAAVLVVCQYLIHLATSFWYPEQLYVVSPVAGMTALVMMRWSGWAAIHAVLGGLLYAALSGGSWQQLLIYGIGNLASLLALLMFRIWGKERLRKDGFLCIVFAIATQLLMQLGRAGMAALFGYSAAVCLGFITTDVLSILFTAFIVWVVRRIEGLFEDQKHYLLRIQQEQQVERGEPF